MAKTRKAIYAGAMVEECIYPRISPKDSPAARAAKHKASTEAQKAFNNKSAMKQLARLLACNFGKEDLFCSLTYSDKRLPANREAAKACMRAFIRLLKRQRVIDGDYLIYVYNTENLHGERRLHHHIVINAGRAGILERDIEIIKSLWAYGFADIEPISKANMDAAGQYVDYEHLAAYMTKERNQDKPNGAQLWTACRAKEWRKPEVITEIVPDDMTIDTPAGAIEIERDAARNIYGSRLYLKYAWPLDASRRAAYPGSGAAYHKPRKQKRKPCPAA